LYRYAEKRDPLNLEAVAWCPSFMSLMAKKRKVDQTGSPLSGPRDQTPQVTGDAAYGPRDQTQVAGADAYGPPPPKVSDASQRTVHIEAVGGSGGGGGDGTLLLNGSAGVSGGSGGAVGGGGLGAGVDGVAGGSLGGGGGARLGAGDARLGDGNARLGEYGVPVHYGQTVSDGGGLGGGGGGLGGAGDAVHHTQVELFRGAREAHHRGALGDAAYTAAAAAANENPGMAAVANAGAGMAAGAAAAAGAAVAGGKSLWDATGNLSAAAAAAVGAYHLLTIVPAFSQLFQSPYYYEATTLMPQVKLIHVNTV
jgi:hypothetical protein